MPLKKLNSAFSHLEGFFLTFMLVAMIVLAFAQVLLRNFFDTGLNWADPVVRHLVLWVGFLGAAVAAKTDGHLAMDLASRFLPDRIKRATAFLVEGSAAFICILLALASFKFLLLEKEEGTALAEFVIRGKPWAMPAYWAVAVIPFGFYVMGVRFARKANLLLGILVALLLPFLTFGPFLDLPPALQAILQKILNLSGAIPTSGPLFIMLAVGIGIIGLLGAPLFVVFGAIGLLCFHSAGIDSSASIIEMYRLAAAPILIAIPLFTFAGYMMAESKTPERIVALAKWAFGWMPAGLAGMTIVSCAIFTALTGASGVTIIALGGLLHPILVKKGYEDRFSMGLVTTCGSVGLMFPPSLPLILYGLISQTSVDRLFLAGLAPGAFIILLLWFYSFVKNPYWGRQVRELYKKEPGDLKNALQALWLLPVPAIILGGIYGGWITASEAAAVTAFYVFFIEIFIYRNLSLTRDIPRIARQSMVLVGCIIVIFAVAMGLTSYLVDKEVPMKLLEWIRTYITSKWAFLLILNLFLLIVGSIMDIFSAIIVVVPMIVPIAKEFHVDPVHLGIIFLTNLEIGYLHPPVGLNLFLSSIRFKRSIVSLYWDTFPFLLLLVFALGVVTYAPDMAQIAIHWTAKHGLETLSSAIQWIYHLFQIR